MGYVNEKSLWYVSYLSTFGGYNSSNSLNYNGKGEYGALPSH